MQSIPSSDSAKTTKRSGKQFPVRFHDDAQYKKIRRAAAKAQADRKKQMGKKFPNVSLFMVEASEEKADKILAEDK